MSNIIADKKDICGAELKKDCSGYQRLVDRRLQIVIFINIPANERHPGKTYRTRN